MAIARAQFAIDRVGLAGLTVAAGGDQEVTMLPTNLIWQDRRVPQERGRRETVL